MYKIVRAYIHVARAFTTTVQFDNFYEMVKQSVKDILLSVKPLKSKKEYEKGFGRI